MRLFDIGANRGDAAFAGLKKGFTEVIALEPAPRIYKELVRRTIYSSITPLKLAVSDADGKSVEFYEADEDGLSTLNQDWLTSDSMPYAGKPHRTIKANTITVDTLADIYGEPDLMKIDVEGAEWNVFRGMTRYHGKLAFEWTENTLDEHDKQLMYLHDLGYRDFSPQFITHHLEEPAYWYPIDKYGRTTLTYWVRNSAQGWKETGWKAAGLRPTADVGMCWVR